MAFFKPIYKKMSKKWHPQAVSVGKPIEMDELCKQIALISTVSSADSKATLEALGLVLGSRTPVAPSTWKVWALSTTPASPTARAWTAPRR